jgi:excinuclease ABC subunit A
MATTGLRCAALAFTTSRISTSICRGPLVVITGLSGSGKSSLAFDTIYAEGQRRYVESLSAYARQFLEQMEKPDVDLIDGLSPAISIEQKTTGSNPRSTVGTVTEIYDYLRLLFANIGIPHCYNCGREISSQSLERILDLVMLVSAPTRASTSGAAGARPEGRVQEGAAGAAPARLHQGAHRRPVPIARRRVKLDRRRNHTSSRGRPADREVGHRAAPVRIARRRLSLADDIVVVNTSTAAISCSRRRLACVAAASPMPEMTPRAFSFNSPHGACADVSGTRCNLRLRRKLVVPDESLSLLGGAIRAMGRGDRKLVRDAIRRWRARMAWTPTRRLRKLPSKHRNWCSSARRSRQARQGRRQDARRAAETSTATTRRSSSFRAVDRRRNRRTSIRSDETSKA